MQATIRALAIALILSLLHACSESDQLGLIDARTKSAISYVDDVKPILDARCVTCHACYDAPCQLKLTAYDGIARGASKDKVYEPTRLAEAPLNRLYFDAERVVDWRSRGFHSVLSESAEQQKKKDQFSIVVGMLDLKADNPQPLDYQQIESPIDDPSTWQCASDAQEFRDYVDDYPQGGMPHALPGLSKDETDMIKRWISAGAENDSDYSLSESERSWISKWEDFLNQDSLKAQLVARYIYEHLFLGSLYSDQTTPGRYFQMVRSSTPPGEPLKVIATRRPYDDPGVARVYYRLRVNKETVVAKTHMPYRLDDGKHEDWTKWFLQADYAVTEVPGYAIETAANPFKTFASLPAKARYKLMLSEANFTVKGFIKGPVCKGPTAVNVINEHFWVFFIDPEHQGGEEMNDYLAKVTPMLDMPAEKEDTLNLLGAWDEFADKEKAFLKERTRFIEQNLNEDGIFTHDLIWHGDGNNPNAALTIFRHFDNASVHQGMNGQAPKTAWVIDYPLLERIHYLLVAGYDVYGNISHQLLSRIYMDFLRMEGESMFLTFLRQDQREQIRQYWYREADQRIENFMRLTDVSNQSDSIIASDEPDPKLALYEKFAAHIGNALKQKYQLRESKNKTLVDGIELLHREASSAFMFFPQVTFIEIYSENSTEFFTLIRNTGHLNNTSLLLEKIYIEEDESTISVIPGFIGPRPNALMRIPQTEFGQFIDKTLAMSSGEDYAQLMDDYGIRRTNPEFWQHYDNFLVGFRKFSAIDYGVLDLNKLENR